MKTVYVSGALQAARNLDAARNQYEAFAALLETNGVRAYLPHKATDPVVARALTSAEVFRRDIDALAASDAVAAFLGEPSLGVGAEIGLAVGRGKPVVGLVPTGVPVSRFVLGLLEANRSATVVEYQDLSGAVTGVVAWLNSAH